MPLIKSKSPKAFEKNLKTEMRAGKPQDQALAIAYSVKRKAHKKASGGTVESGSKDMNMAKGGMYAEGGAISAKTEKRPMPSDLHDDAVMESHNRAKKALIDDGWTGQPTTKQAQSNNGRMVKPIKQPRMVPSDAFSTRLRDEEADLEQTASPGRYDEQPPKRDDEEGPDRQGPDNVDRSKPHSGPKAYAKGGKIEESDRSSHNINKRTEQEPEDHGIQEQERMEEHDLEMGASPSEDEGSEDARRRNEQGPNRQGPGIMDKSRPHSANLNNYAEGGDVESPEDESYQEMLNRMVREAAQRMKAEKHPEDQKPNPVSDQNMAEGGRAGGDMDSWDDDGHEDSIAAAIMARRDRLHAEIDSGAHDLDSAVRMAEGGEVDLSLNADEEPNNEDQMSFEALKKENYSETPGLEELDQPHDSNEHGDEREDESENKHDRVSSIRSKMMARRQFKSR